MGFTDEQKTIAGLAGFVLAAVGFSIYTLTLYFRAKNSKNWLSTTGVILSSKIVSSSYSVRSSHSRPRYYEHVEYQYEVEGKVLKNHIVSIGAQLLLKNKQKAEENRAYKNNQEVKVYYNPKKHKQAALIVGESEDSTVALIGAVVFGAMALICFWALLGKIT